MNGPQRVQPGQVLREYPGGSHNAFVAAWEKVFHDMPPGNGTGASGSSQRLTVQIENATGSDLGAEFPIVELGDPSVTPVDVPGVAREGVRLKGKLTTADTPLDKLAILKGPCPQGAFAPGIIAGPAWCSVNITDGNHTRAVPQASTAALASSHNGALMLWHEAGTGLKKALVLLGADGPEMVLVRVSANIAARSGATYSSGLAELIQADPDTGLLTGLDVSIEVANAFDQQISSGTYVLAVWDERNKQWFAVYPGKGQRVFLAKTSPGSGIAARSGTTVTSQSCEVFGITGTTLTTNSTFETVWNVSGQAVPADTYFPVVQEEITGKFIAAFGGSGGQAIIVKTSPGSGIAARDGVSLSSQSCEVFKLVEDVPAVLQTTGEFETVYNVEPRPVPADEYFVAVQDKNSSLWVAVVPLGFVRCQATLTSTLAITDPTITVDNVVATKGRSPLADPDDPLETLMVENSFGLAALNDTTVFIEYHEDTDDWHLYAIQPQTVEVVIDVRVNGTTLQKMTRDVLVIPAGAASAWTTYHTGTTCS